MSFLSRVRPSVLHSQRTYSSFFSSNPGGGRYSNSSKPPKPVVASSSTKSKRASSPQPASASTEANDAVPESLQSDKTVNSDLVNTKADTPSVGQSSSTSPALSMRASGYGNFTAPIHPSIDTKDFKLLRFFSGHRPLLLLAQPSTILQSVPPSTSFFPTPGNNASAQSPSSFLNELPESTQEADAEAARQLSRALMMNHAGAAVAWENTLRTLGLNVDQQPERVGLQERMDKEWQDVLMDSTKRKRRKKMKKHKLRKRRKATRAQRLKIGR